MMTRKEAQTATLDQLTDELAAAGWDSTQTTRAEAHAAVISLISEIEGLARRLLRRTFLGEYERHCQHWPMSMARKYSRARKRCANRIRTTKRVIIDLIHFDGLEPY